MRYLGAAAWPPWGLLTHGEAKSQRHGRGTSWTARSWDPCHFQECCSLCEITIGDYFGNICVYVASEIAGDFLGTKPHHLGRGATQSLHQAPSWHTGLLTEDWKFMNLHLFSKSEFAENTMSLGWVSPGAHLLNWNRSASCLVCRVIPGHAGG